MLPPCISLLEVDSKRINVGEANQPPEILDHVQKLSLVHQLVCTPLQPASLEENKSSFAKAFAQHDLYWNESHDIFYIPITVAH